MPDTVPDFERVADPGHHAVDCGRDVGEVVGMDALQPRLHGVADLLVLAADQAEPARRETHPVRGQMPLPEPLALRTAAEML